MPSILVAEFSLADPELGNEQNKRPGGALPGEAVKRLRAVTVGWVTISSSATVSEVLSGSKKSCWIEHS